VLLLLTMMSASPAVAILLLLLLLLFASLLVLLRMFPWKRQRPCQRQRPQRVRAFAPKLAALRSPCCSPAVLCYLPPATAGLVAIGAERGSRS
jgi:hypothetical protein